MIKTQQEYNALMKLYNNIPEELTSEGLYIPEGKNNIRRAKIADELMTFNYKYGNRKRLEDH